MNAKKKVTFDLDSNTIFETYSKIDYNRNQTNSLMYRRYYKLNEVSDIEKEWFQMQDEMDRYKLKEMIVHINSIHNIYLF